METAILDTHIEACVTHIYIHNLPIINASRLHFSQQQGQRSAGKNSISLNL